MDIAAVPIILLFRQDLRLKDNPALVAACQTGRPIIPLYILDDENPGKWKLGGASRWWLHYSLKSLQDALRLKGSQLFVYRGKTVDIVKALIHKHQVGALYWNRCYEPYAIELGRKLKNILPQSHSFNGSLLFEPWEVFNQQNQPFKVFTPFWRKCVEISAIDTSLEEPEIIWTKQIEAASIDSLKLLPAHPNWANSWNTYWQVGEEAAHKKLTFFSKQLLDEYETDRDVPSLTSTSLLSPHLHFGEISPRQIYNAVKNLPNSSKFLSELGWREFSYYHLYHFPQLPELSWRSEFDNFPWEINTVYLKKWQQGNTGYPIVDAGMRQLWLTGWMHNRVRMIVASFLVKDLFMPWQEGARWFWDTLVDADLASNSASWQWVAGCGFDAAPFFRIFNPIVQGQKFDPNGIYIKRWIPELADVPAASIHAPWTKTNRYVSPVVDHDQARKRALQIFQSIKQNGIQ